MDNIAKKYLSKFEKSKAFRENWVSLFEECYEYALPQRESFYAETAGQRRDDKIFDETAVVGVQEFASRLQHGIVPNFARWADFAAGSEVPPEDRDRIDNELDDVTEYVFDIIQNSNFGQEIHESFMDLAVGTGVMAVEEGDALNPVIFSAIPLPHVVLDTGPDDRIDHVFRERKKVPFEHLPLMYPNSSFDPKVMALMSSNGTTDVVEVVCRDYSRRNEEAYFHYAICQRTRTILHQKEMVGVGSNPYVCFRWTKCAGEVYGRGPLINALSAIKTTNLTIEIILENAQMAISGIYQMEDDGVVNPDTIQLVPGSIIPKAMGSAGLQPINAAGRFDVAQLVLGDMRQNIKRALYNDLSVWQTYLVVWALHLVACNQSLFSQYCSVWFTFLGSKAVLNCLLLMAERLRFGLLLHLLKPKQIRTYQASLGFLRWLVGRLGLRCCSYLLTAKKWLFTLRKNLVYQTT